MRNVDEIKRLKHEIGRYRKKVADQQKENRELREQLEAFQAGMRELNMASDMILARTAMDYGEEVHDDQSGEIIGRRLRLGERITAALLDEVKVVSRFDRKERCYIVEAMMNRSADRG